MQLKITHNFSDVVPKIEAVGKQARFATAVALTRTANAVKQAEEAEVGKVFDKPTPFTRRGFRYKGATKDRLVAEVYIMPAQARYLATQIFGGLRERKRFEQRLATDVQGERTGFFVPGQGVRLNVSGNLTRAQVVKIAEGLRVRDHKRQIFAGAPGGAPFEDLGAHGPAWTEATADRGRAADLSQALRLLRLGIRVAKERFPREFDRAMADALRTAR